MEEKNSKSDDGPSNLKEGKAGENENEKMDAKSGTASNESLNAQRHGHKRRPGKQLTHENWDEEDEPEEKGEFVKAKESELKGRKIARAKRRMRSSDPSSTDHIQAESEKSTEEHKPDSDSKCKNPFISFSFTTPKETEKPYVNPFEGFSFSSKVVVPTKDNCKSDKGVKDDNANIGTKRTKLCEEDKVESKTEVPVESDA